MKKFSIVMLLLFLAVVTYGQISKKEAKKIVSEYLDITYSSDSILVYLRKDIAEKNLSIRTFNKSITSATDRSYVFFVDKNPIQNWGHPCIFIFVDVRTGNVSILDWKLPPNNLESWEFLNIIEEQEPESKLNIVSSNIPMYKSLRSSDHCYAIIISGGGNPGANWSRYWNDCSFIYSTLVNVYGYDDSHIKCLIADGTNPNADRRIGMESYDSSPLDLDGDSDNDIDYSATKSNITTVFNNLASVIGKDDHLYIFVTDHGDRESGRDAEIILWYESIRDDQFADEVDKIYAGQITIVMGQCYSGGFIDDLSSGDRIIATACDYDEPSYCMGYFTYDEFVFDWIASVAGEDPYENPVDADDNNDGFISMVEAFNYAEAHDSASETPQYDSSPDDLGFVLGLGFSLYISGPEYVCSSGTEFTIDDMPNGDTIIWSTSEDISRTSAQGSNPCEFETSENGDYGWIGATIANDGMEYDLNHKEVWQGKPDPHILGPEEVECYWPEWYYIDAESYQWGDWQWSTDYNMEILSVTNGHKAEIQGLSEGYGQIFLEATNECGSNENRLVVWVDCFDFKLIPNPADEYLRIELDDSKIQESNNIDYEIIIFDNQQRPVKKTRSQNLLTTINTKSLSDGVYYVQIIYKGKLYAKQLIIQH